MTQAESKLKCRNAGLFSDCWGVSVGSLNEALWSLLGMNSSRRGRSHRWPTWPVTKPWSLKKGTNLGRARSQRQILKMRGACACVCIEKWDKCWVSFPLGGGVLSDFTVFFKLFCIFTLFYNEYIKHINRIKFYFTNRWETDFPQWLTYLLLFTVEQRPFSLPNE